VTLDEMANEDMMRLIEVAARSVVIVSIGGGADVVIAKAIAMTMIREGATSVDIVQTKARSMLDREETLQDLGELRLSKVGTFAECEFLEYLTTVPNAVRDARARTRGKRLAAALAWQNGRRFYAAGRSPSWLEFIRSGGGQDRPYEAVICVDGGGDVLGVDEDSDIKVLKHIEQSMPAESQLFLYVVGMGADGTPIELFKDARLEGWSKVSEGNLQVSFADDLEGCLRETSCWLDDPLKWDAPNSLWSYGLNVPQIVSLAIRNIFPFMRPVDGIVTFPRRNRLVEMRADWLRSARLYRKNSAIT
jgi:hypothetical protein